MPELPEVETIRRSLESYIVGKTIEDVQVPQPRLRRPVPVAELKRWALGQRIVRLDRRGKYLLWHLQNNAVVAIHLGMSGRLGYYTEVTACEKHTHVIVTFAEGGVLHFRDPRRFGSFDVFEPGRACLQQMGVEPLSADYSRDYFSAKCGDSKRAIKTLLMDQKIVVGVGNIYATEALFLAGIHPLRPGLSLQPDEVQRLCAAVVTILNRAVARGGTTLNDFRDARGEPGFFQMDLAVYDQAGKACPNCGTAIRKIVFNGRSAYVCETCQQ